MILALLVPTDVGAAQAVADDLDRAVAMARDAAVRMDGPGLLFVRERLRRFTESPGTASRAHYQLALAEFVSLLAQDYSVMLRMREETEERLDRADVALARALAGTPQGSSLHAHARTLRSLVLRLRANVREGSGAADPESAQSAGQRATRTMEEAIRLAPDDLDVAAGHALLLLMTPSAEAQSQAVEALDDLDARIGRALEAGREIPSGWLFLFTRSMRVRQLVSAGDPERALEVALETLALEPDFEPVQSLLPSVEARVAAAALRFRPRDPARLTGLEWEEVARDPAGDGVTDSLPDVRALHLTTTPERLWLRFTLEGDVPRMEFGMNLAVDMDADSSNGARWWGENQSFRWDRLFTVWLESDEDGGYRGVVGMGGPEGPPDLDPANLHRGDLDFAFLRDGLAMGIPWTLLPDSGGALAVAAVGSNRTWNDDIPGSGSIVLPTARPFRPPRSGLGPRR